MGFFSKLFKKDKKEEPKPKFYKSKVNDESINDFLKELNEERKIEKEVNIFEKNEDGEETIYNELGVLTLDLKTTYKNIKKYNKANLGTECLTKEDVDSLKEILEKMMIYLTENIGYYHGKLTMVDFEPKEENIFEDREIEEDHVYDKMLSCLINLKDYIYIYLYNTTYLIDYNFANK